MNGFDKVPTGIKAAIFIGVMLIGPIMVGSLWFGGVKAGMLAIVAIFVYFSFFYIVGVRRYMSDRE